MALYQVTVVEAEKLRKADFFSKSDPYVIVYQKSRFGTIKGRTTVCQNTLNPYWNETIGVIFSEDTPITFKCYDDDQRNSPYDKSKLESIPSLSPDGGDKKRAFKKYVRRIKGVGVGPLGKVQMDGDDPLGKVKIDFNAIPIGRVATLRLKGTGAKKHSMMRIRVDQVQPETWSNPQMIAKPGQVLDMRSVWPYYARISYRIPNAGQLAELRIPPIDIALVGFNDVGKIKIEAFAGDPVEKGVNISYDQRAEGADLVGCIIMGISPDLFTKASHAAIIANTTSSENRHFSDLNLNCDLYYSPGERPIMRIPLNAASSTMIIGNIRYGIFEVLNQALSSEYQTYSEALPELLQSVGLPLSGSRYTTVIPGRETSLTRVAALSKVGQHWLQCELGLAWDTYKPVDLDSNVAAFDHNGNELYTVSFSQLRSPDGAILHGGDNRTGEGDGDDETINLNLALVDPRVKYLFLSVTSYSGPGFAQLKKVKTAIRVRGRQIAKITLSEKSGLNAVVLAAFERDPQTQDWSMWTLLRYSQGKVSDDLLPIYRQAIRDLPYLKESVAW